MTRFWAKVDKTTDCWLWTGGKHRQGYGQISIARKMALAHRVSYELEVGPIPPGMSVLHKCDVPGCVRPDHLFTGTQKDNMADCARKGRTVSFNGAKRVCKRGHKFTPANTYVHDGKRLCRTCRAAAWKKFYAGRAA
jgi:hypothetical protein